MPGDPAEREGTEIERVRVNRRTSGRRQPIEQSPPCEGGGAQWMHHMRGHGVARERRAVDHEHTVSLPGQQHRRRRTRAARSHDDRVVCRIHVCPPEIDRGHARRRAKRAPAKVDRSAAQGEFSETARWRGQSRPGHPHLRQCLTARRRREDTTRVVVCLRIVFSFHLGNYGAAAHSVTERPTPRRRVHRCNQSTAMLDRSTVSAPGSAPLPPRPRLLPRCPPPSPRGGVGSLLIPANSRQSPGGVGRSLVVGATSGGR